ncbi:MAG TPA: cytochrome c [Anaeromyxobacteraceae bacterium]
MRVLASLIAGATALLAHAAHAGPPPRKTPELLEIGQVSFKLNCASCHGSSGEGDGVSAASLNPRPRNFVTEPLEHGATAARIFRTLREGVAGTAMIGFTFLPDEERWALAYYVLDLRARGKAAGKRSGR